MHQGHIQTTKRMDKSKKFSQWQGPSSSGGSKQIRGWPHNSLWHPSAVHWVGLLFQILDLFQTYEGGVLETTSWALWSRYRAVRSLTRCQKVWGNVSLSRTGLSAGGVSSENRFFYWQCSITELWNKECVQEYDQTHCMNMEFQIVNPPKKFHPPELLFHEIL